MYNFLLNEEKRNLFDNIKDGPWIYSNNSDFILIKLKPKLNALKNQNV